MAATHSRPQSSSLLRMTDGQSRDKRQGLWGREWAATVRVIWLCACVRYWPDRRLAFECATCSFIIVYGKQTPCDSTSFPESPATVGQFYSTVPARQHPPLIRFNRIGRGNNRINNRNNDPSPENNRGG